MQLKRQKDIEKKNKLKKIDWLKKMYVAYLSRNMHFRAQPVPSTTNEQQLAFVLKQSTLLTCPYALSDANGIFVLVHGGEEAEWLERPLMVIYKVHTSNF